MNKEQLITYAEMRGPFSAQYFTRLSPPEWTVLREGERGLCCTTGWTDACDYFPDGMTEQDYAELIALALNVLGGHKGKDERTIEEKAEDEVARVMAMGYSASHIRLAEIRYVEELIDAAAERSRVRDKKA